MHADIDRNRDGTLSAEEQRAQATLVLDALTLKVDGTPVRAELADVRFPDADAIKRGEGTIRLHSSAILPRQSSGVHQLQFRNTHHPSDPNFDRTVPDRVPSGLPVGGRLTP